MKVKHQHKNLRLKVEATGKGKLNERKDQKTTIS